MNYLDAQTRVFRMFEEAEYLINGTSLEEKDLREHTLISVVKLEDNKGYYEVQLLEANIDKKMPLDNLLQVNDAFLISSTAIELMQVASNSANLPHQFMANARTTTFDDPQFFRGIQTAAAGVYVASEADNMAAFYNGTMEYRDDNFVKVEKFSMNDFKFVPTVQTTVANRNAHAGERWNSALYNTYLTGAGKAKIILTMPDLADLKLFSGDPLGNRVPNAYNNVKVQNYAVIRLKGVLLNGASKPVSAAVLEKRSHKRAA
jgi:hypothetical protein